MVVIPLEMAMEIEASVPLDNDGFLDRQCPACNRLFRWLPSDESEPPQDGRYGCPYCRARNSPDEFWTDSQREYLTHEAGKAVLSQLASEGWKVESHGTPTHPTASADLTEVTFSCHESEPIKAYPEWVEAGQPLHCIICGASSGGS